MTKHPATFSDKVLQRINEILIEAVGVRRILDPFAGIGRLGELFHGLTVLNEIEPEWARQAKRKGAIYGGHPVVGNALHLPFRDGVFDCVCTSPVYGNRMSDHHDARDDSRRITYRHTLGRPLHPENSGQLQWGHGYRVFHQTAWREATRVLRLGGLFILNISNHIRAGKLVQVSRWHIAELKALGYVREDSIRVRTPRMRFGANHKSRVSHELIHVFRRVV